MFTFMIKSGLWTEGFSIFFCVFCVHVINIVMNDILRIQCVLIVVKSDGKTAE